LEKFKKVSFELLDIGVFYGQQGVGKVKSLPVYQKVDSVLHIDDKFALVRKHGEELYTLLDQKLRPIVQNVFFLYDEANKTITSYINCVTTKQFEITAYVTKTYTTAQVSVEGAWMRLDFDHNGSVSVEDLKHSMTGLFDFLRNFDVIQ
jgi:hypothetical protein